MVATEGYSKHRLPWIYDNNCGWIVNLIASLRANKCAINKPGGHDKRAIIIMKIIALALIRWDF